MMSPCWSVCLLVAAVLMAGTQAGSVFDLMSADPDLSEFLALVKEDKLVLAIIRHAEGTVFAPTNAALQQYRGQPSASVLKYHLVNLALSVDQLSTERSVPTRLKGSQPVFVSVPRPGDVFINNARIVRGDLKASSQDEQEDQVLHVIDEVLQPTIPHVVSHSMHFNPSALELLTSSDKYDLGGESVSKFLQTVLAEEKNDVFNSAAFHTFFVPVDKNYEVPDRIQGQTLNGHVIPNHALFTRTMGSKSFRTLAFDDMLKVTIKLRSELLPRRNSSEANELEAAPAALDHSDRIYEAQSTILMGDIVLQPGSVLVKVVKPNIAVKNGVVHLIEKPLMVIDGNVLQFIQERQADLFHEFYNLLLKHADDFIVKLMTTTYFTVFVPSNEAFYNVDQQRLKEIKSSPAKLKALLSLHVVGQKVTTENVRKLAASTGQLYSVPSEDAGRSLYLSVTHAGELERTLTVEGGGTNATVIVPDIGRNNGVIHIIDRFLGIPYQSVAERLAVDPTASVTSSLVKQSGFSKTLGKKNEKVTLFVPSDMAWQRLRVQLPSSYKAILANKKSQEVAVVLKRHLVPGQALTMKQLAILSAKEGGIATATDQMVKVENIPGSPEYLIKWENLQARVTRSDEECTNGYVHVIDAVLVAERDVKAASMTAAAEVATPAVPGLLLTAVWITLRL